MSLFQKSVINSIKQDESLIALRWAQYQNYLSKIDFIKTVKEEKYQDGFLKDIFEACLGYTLDSTNPANFNLEREKKNETDGKKADGVIYVNNEIVGIVELKDQKTKNLDAVEGQAFNYHNSHSNSKYIIISNFNELRFYIDKKTMYEKFNLFSLSYEDFKMLHLLLSFESIRDNVPLKLKEKSANFEQTISKELYRDFSQFRSHLFENIIKNNDLDRSLLLRLTQKLCDRIIFILFAEDRSLLKANTVKEIRLRHAADGFGDRSMYDYYKLYFNAINTGNDKLGIPKYNGGLFATDEMLDSLKIDDNYLDMEAQKLSDFDFDSDISVNILGHIFEQSLTDLEEMNASINDTKFDKKKSKRKKDGVFYTPEYITRYIVENTLGKLCSDKKEALKIEPETVVVNPRKLTKSEQSYKETLMEYREWLTHLKILDPACGSGAFLNQALEFLIREHTLIRDLLLPYEDLMIGYEIEKSILEHNLYGVDINEDAVEIAKLSLWLRTAHKGRELINLGAKIKCGNSLIADKNVAENAFVWEDEFPEVFAQGGFDVVIGNPPYVRSELIQYMNDYLKQNYDVYNHSSDLFAYFYEKGASLLSEDGIFGYISNTFDKTSAGEILREFLTKKTQLIEYVDLTDIVVFEGATTYPIIAFLKKGYKANNVFEYIKIPRDMQSNNIDLASFVSTEVMQDSLNSEGWSFSSLKTFQLLEKLKKYPTVKELFGKCYYGVKTALNEAFIIQQNIKTRQEHIKPIYEGKEIKKWVTPESVQQLIFFPSKWTKQMYGVEIDEATALEKMLVDYPDIMNQLIPYTEQAKKRYDQGDFWWELRNCAYYDLFEKPKIIFPNLQNSNKFSLDSDGVYINAPAVLLPTADKALLAILNSKIVWFFLKSICVVRSGGYIEVKPQYFEQIPIVELKNDDRLLLIGSTEKMLALHRQLQTTKQNFINELRLEKIPQKLQKFEELEFDEFVKEYTKAKKLKFADKLEERNFKNDWSALFENDKKVVSELKAEIAKTDKEIDAMVYVLYGLSEDEIGIVEGENK